MAGLLLLAALTASWIVGLPATTLERWPAASPHLSSHPRRRVLRSALRLQHGGAHLGPASATLSLAGPTPALPVTAAVPSHAAESALPVHLHHVVRGPVPSVRSK